MNVVYYSFSPSRADAKWESSDSVKVIEEFKEYYENDPEDVLVELQEVDSEFGGVYALTNSLVLEEEVWLEVYCLEAISEAYDLEIVDDVPTKEAWIRLYAELEAPKTQKSAQSLTEKTNISYPEAEDFLVSFLEDIRPVVQDLKQTSDSVFVRDYHDGYDLSPKTSHDLLAKRTLHLIETRLKK